MTRNEAIEKFTALGGRRNMIIGAGVGCLSVTLGLLLACGLIFGWVGNTVKAAVTASPVEQSTVAQDWGLAGEQTRGKAAAICAAGQRATGTVYGDGSWAGWQCVEDGGK